MTLSSADIATLARLHVAALPESQVSLLGEGYARAFYRYLARSSHETLVVERQQGRIAGAAVLSLDPQGLTRRLLLSTPLVLWALLKIFAVLAHRSGQQDDDAPREKPWAGLPELLLIFCDENCRGDGVGTRLITGIESVLAQQGMDRYVVKTLDTPGNQALTFYAGRGFTPLGKAKANGLPFAYFTKSLPGLSSGDR